MVGRIRTWDAPGSSKGMIADMSRRIVVAGLGLLSFATSASAECPWVLWVEAPVGSDQWSVAGAPKSQFETKEECQRQADDLNAFELTMAETQRAGGDAHDAFACFPCTVDPRPEGALLHEAVGSRGAKGK